MNIVFLLLRVTYWCLLASLPFVLQSQYVDFVLWGIKQPEAECLQTGIPFVMHVEIFSWALMLLLWPLVFWNLGGNYLWVRFKHRKQASNRAGHKDA
jgi:hypothetical protein